MTNFNISDFLDQFGNLKNEFEIICYHKLVNGQWEENKRFNSGRSHFIIKDQLYYVSGYNSLIKLNMDFNNESCGACFQVGNEIENKRKITGNEILFTYDSKVFKKQYLHKQSYSDGSCFYTLQDSSGNWKVSYGSKNLNDLIVQLEHEIDVYSKYENDLDSIEIYKDIITTKNKIISDIKILIKTPLAS